jgi:DNA-binding FadR family transcriptional regulator
MDSAGPGLFLEPTGLRPPEAVPAADPPAIDLASVLRPVRAGNAFEETVERLLSAIKLGLVAPGERFPPERDLAAQLGVSRLTLREAIRDLQGAGYVSSQRGRFGGTFVTYTRPVPNRAELTRLVQEEPDKLEDALTFRGAVEVGAAEALATVLSRGARCVPGETPGTMAGTPGGPGDGSGRYRDTGRIRQALLARLADVENASPEDYRRQDTLFHLSIAELSGSGLLAAACADARLRLNDLLDSIPVLQRNIDHAARQHQAIVRAILAGDPAAARAAVAEHLEGTALLLRGFLG